MKKFKYILLLVTTLMLGSCADDLLDTKPLDKFSEANVWTDPSLTQGFIYDTYNSAIREFLTYQESSNLFTANDLHTDNQVRTGGSGRINLEDFDKFYNAGWGTPTRGNAGAFSYIRKTNLIIEKCSESEVFTEAEKTKFIAEGHMLRALLYFAKARIFGKYIIIDKVLSPDDNLELSRSATIKETYDFILSDLQIAAAGLPESGEAGALTKGAAYALMAEAALHGAAYIESGKSEYYQVAKKASEDLFALGQYELDDDYAGMFNTYDGGLGSKEIILAYYRHADNTKFSDTPMQRIVPNHALVRLAPGVSPPLTEGFSGWSRMQPTFDLVSNYLVNDEDGISKKWDETSYYQDYQDNGGYVSKFLFDNRDSRFYASVVHDSSMYFNQLVTYRIGGNFHWNATTGSKWGMTASGFNQRKGLYEAVRLNAGANTPYHYVLFRLGRSYLNYAEVMLRLNQPDVAIEYINKTRTIHGGLSELSTGLSIDDVWKWFKIERRVDLFYEGDRYWSLLRWGKEAGDIIIPELSTDKKAVEIAADGKSFELIEIPNGYATRNKMNFSVKRYLFPVPEGERQLNPNLDQNPGW